MRCCPHWLTQHCGDGAEEAGDAGDDERHAAGHTASERSAVDDEDGDHVDRDLDSSADERADVDAHGAGQISGKQRQSEVDERARKPELRHITNAAQRTVRSRYIVFLWPPCGIGQDIIFLPCGFFLLSPSFFLLFSAPNLSGRRLDVYHTSTHGVALVRI